MKALLEDQYPIPLETAKVAEKPKVTSDFVGFVNKSPNVAALKEAQASAQDYWEGMADDAVEEGGLLGFPKYLGSKTMGALADVGHGIGQSVDALIHNPEEGVSGLAKGVANFGPEAFNAATKGVKTVADGYSLLSDSVLGTDTEGFRNSNPYEIDPLFELNEAEVGANLIAGVGAGVLTKLPKVGASSKNTINMRSPSELMGVEPATEELISAVSKKRDVVFAQQGSDELRMLDFFGAEASVGGANNTHILLRSNPSKAALLEEFLHGTQSKLGIVDRLGTSGLGSAETHVKDFMIRHQKMLGLGDEDVQILQTLRDKGL